MSPLDEPSHSSHQLDAAKELVLRYRKGELRDRPIDEEQLWRAKTLYNSAFHPDTGNLTSIQQSKFLIPTSFKERKCFFQEECLLRSDQSLNQVLFLTRFSKVPFNMVITGCMMTFYKTTPAVIFWQWFNQSFNALVNYTNRFKININCILTKKCFQDPETLSSRQILW